MKELIHLGAGRFLLPIPAFIWKRQIRQFEQNTRHDLAFMTPVHQAVRNFVVRELPRYAKPIPPEEIARALDLPLEQVVTVLDQLEERMTFLYRNSEKAVSWAYPMTVEQTPHHLTLSTGETVYAACGLDTLATPFVLGRLRKESLSVRARTSCICCNKPLDLEIDSEINCRVHTPGATPVMFMPLVEFSTLNDPSIIDAF